MNGKRPENSGLLVVICCRGFPSQSVLRMPGASTEENEKQHPRLHKEHPVWLSFRSSEPNWKSTYVDEVVIGHHNLPSHPEDVSSIRGRNIL